jgi:hypothetical protein
VTGVVGSRVLVVVEEVEEGGWHKGRGQSRGGSRGRAEVSRIDIERAVLSSR